MKPIFKICKVGTCSIGITGLETQDDQYTEVFSDQYGSFRYEDTVTINILTSLDSKEEVVDIKYDINEHKVEDLEDKSELSFFGDGVYRVHHVILPTLEWLDEFKSKGYHLDIYEEIYVYVDGGVFKLENEQLIPFDITQIPFINPCTKSTLTYDIQYTFSTCQLQECYYKYCKEYFNNLCNQCWKDSEYIKNRDLLWMSINIIRYLLDLGRLFEAQNIIEKLHKCSGLCYNTNVKVKSTYAGCGCS